MSDVQTAPGSIVVPNDKIAVFTGPISGAITLADGRQVDVSGPVAVVDTQDEADEVAHLVSMHYVEFGHPEHTEIDPVTGERTQKPFVYDSPAKFDNYKKFGE